MTVPAIPKAVVLHATPQRLRLRILSKRRDGRYFSRLATWLNQQDEIHHYAVNPLTATVLVCHHQPLPIAEFARRAQDAALLQFAPSSAAKLLGTPGAAEVDFTQALRAAPALKPALASFYVVMIAYQISRGQLLAPASTLFVNLASVLRTRE